jgi:hypothetical protein
MLSPECGGMSPPATIESPWMVSDEEPTESEWLWANLGAMLTIGGIGPVITSSVFGMSSGLILPKRWLSKGF